MHLYTVADVFKTLWRIVRATPEERRERFERARLAKRVYDAGQQLDSIARQVGGEFQNDAQAVIDRYDVLDPAKVWPPDEADTILAELRAWTQSGYDLL